MGTTTVCYLIADIFCELRAAPDSVELPRRQVQVSMTATTRRAAGCSLGVLHVLDHKSYVFIHVDTVTVALLRITSHRAFLALLSKVRVPSMGISSNRMESILQNHFVLPFSGRHLRKVTGLMCENRYTYINKCIFPFSCNFLRVESFVSYLYSPFL